MKGFAQAIALLVLGMQGLVAVEPPLQDAGAAARSQIGSHVVFVDVISQVEIKPSGTVFLNFGGKYPDETLKAVVMAETRPRFPEAHKWEGRTVKVEGELTEHEGHKRIILRERGQIALVEVPD